MPSVPISEFEGRVARWAARLRKSQDPVEVTQRGKPTLVILNKEAYDRLVSYLNALEIKLLVEAGERAFAEGRFITHEEMTRRLQARERSERNRA